MAWQAASAEQRAACFCGPPSRPQDPGWDTESAHS